MAYRLVTGRFVIRYAESPGQGPTPDGDTVKFRPDDPSIVEELGLASGVEPKLSAQHRISLRLEGVDALETNFDGSRQDATLGRAARDALLARLGFRDVVWDPARPGQVASAHADELPGWVLSDAVEQNGRLVAFAFPGTSPPAGDGASVPADVAMLRAGVNLQLLADGLVYPLLYTNLPGEVRDLIVELSTAARAGRRGVWARSTADPGSAADLSAGPAALRDLVMWPKLFRRLSRYFAGGRRDLDGFRSWLAGGPADRDDAVLVLDTGARTRLHDLVDVDPVADTVRLTLWPDAFAVLPVTVRPRVTTTMTSRVEPRKTTARGASWTGVVDRESVMAWVRAYEDGWRSGDLDAVARLFTEDVRYRRSPYEPDEVGHEGVGAFWSADVGDTFTVDARPIAVEGRVAVVRLLVHYTAPREQEYSDLWVLTFADDGRVEDFEEWAYWPGRSYTASQG